MDNLINANQDELIKSYCLSTVQNFALKMEQLLDVSSKKENDERLNEILDVCDDFIDALNVQTALENNAENKKNDDNNVNVESENGEDDKNYESEQYQSRDTDDNNSENDGEVQYKDVDEDINVNGSIYDVNTNSESEVHTQQ